MIGVRHVSQLHVPGPPGPRYSYNDWVVPRYRQSRVNLCEAIDLKPIDVLGAWVRVNDYDHAMPAASCLVLSAQLAGMHRAWSDAFKAKASIRIELSARLCE